MLQLHAHAQRCAECRRDATSGRTITLAGPKAFTVEEVIALCEKYADAEADVRFLLPSRSPHLPAHVMHDQSWQVCCEQQLCGI